MHTAPVKTETVNCYQQTLLVSSWLTRKLADGGCFGVRLGMQLLLLTQIMAQASYLHTEDVSTRDEKFGLPLIQSLQEPARQVPNPATSQYRQGPSLVSIATENQARHKQQQANVASIR